MKRLLFKLILCAIISLPAQATQIVPDKSAMCAGCHGAQGISVNPDWPNLAGQHASYFIKQLHDYKQATTRNNAIMTSMLSQLNDDDIQALATFYANLPRPGAPTQTKNLLRGEELYRRGDFKKHITACIACHGPQGTGNAQAGFPALSGQQPGYTVQQLQAFKERARSNDLNSIMRDISARMSKADMQAVADYLTQLH